MNDKDMSIAEYDDIKLVKCKNFDGSYHAQVAETREKESIYYTVEDAACRKSMDVTSMEASAMLRNVNTRGWVIYRCSLLEIPDLGIFADSCYDALAKLLASRHL